MRFSKKSLEGEILIDHTASPGLTAADVAGFGDALVVQGGQSYEGAFVTCSHCQAAVLRNPERTRPREWCARCDKYICDDCAKLMAVTLECRNFQRLVDEVVEVVEKYGSSPLLFPTL